MSRRRRRSHAAENPIPVAVWIIGGIAAAAAVGTGVYLATRPATPPPQPAPTTATLTQAAIDAAAQNAIQDAVNAAGAFGQQGTSPLTPTQLAAQAQQQGNALLQQGVSTATDQAQQLVNSNIPQISL